MQTKVNNSPWQHKALFMARPAAKAKSPLEGITETIAEVGITLRKIHHQRMAALQRCANRIAQIELQRQ